MRLRHALLFLSVVVLLGCAESDSSDPAEKENSPKPTFTHVVGAETAYYTTGPQQGRPPDGRFKKGTRVTLIERAGSYSLVKSQQGIEAYVATEALEKLDRQAAATITPAIQSIAASNNRFACDLYQTLASQESGSLFFSPSSISMALAMTYAGAEGRTEKEMAQVLHFQLPEEELHAAFGAFNRMLTGGKQAGYQLSTANRLWGQEQYGFLGEFLKATRDHYGAELAQVDFLHAAEKAREQINRWVEDETAGKIENLMPPGSLDDMTRLVLTNAVYFKGNWTNPFETVATQNAPFHVTVDRQVEVPMMHQSDEFAYAEDEGVQILELPYGKEKPLSMIILLPKQVDGLPAVEGRLSAETLQQWLAALRVEQVRVFLPRFRLNSEFYLNDALQEMGMTTAFSPEAADFSGMSSQEELYLTAAVHKAFVDVNEEGTEAAAATGIAVGAESARPTPEFRADHPFLFLIRDRRSQAILFLGRLIDPAR